MQQRERGGASDPRCGVFWNSSTVGAVPEVSERDFLLVPLQSGTFCEVVTDVGVAMHERYLLRSCSRDGGVE